VIQKQSPVIFESLSTVCMFWYTLFIYKIIELSIAKERIACNIIYNVLLFMSPLTMLLTVYIYIGWEFVLNCLICSYVVCILYIVYSKDIYCGFIIVTINFSVWLCVSKFCLVLIHFESSLNTYILPIQVRLVYCTII